MKRTALLVLLLCLLCAGAALGERRVMVASDLHYLAPELYEGSELFIRALRTGDGKLTQYSGELLDALLAQARAVRPDALVLTGDLTFNGERVSHIRLAEKLNALRLEGIPVYVIPGNHDIESNAARAFHGSQWSWTDAVTAEEFAAIYAELMRPAEGGAGANLSYHVPLSSELWLAMPDVTVWHGGARVYGVYMADHDAWLEQVLSAADAAGAEVLTFTHHNLIPHTRFSQDTYLMFGHEDMLRRLQAHGVRLNLSGHMHIQHIARDGGTADAATGAWSVWPHRWALVTLRDDGTLTYEARTPDESFLPEGFAAMSEEWFTSITVEKSRPMLADRGIPEADQEAMLAFSARFNRACFSGTFRSGDPGWREDAGWLLWQKYLGESASVLYMNQVMEESPENNLRLVQ